jgi:hypothetical protein
MHKRIYLSDFMEAFDNHGRDDQFSPAALEALFEFFEELEDETGELVELNVIDICCSFTEYDSPQDCANELGLNADGMDSEEVIDLIRDHTLVIPLKSGGIVIQNY